MKRMAVVIDYQNVHMTAGNVFMRGRPREESLISPLKFGERLAYIKNESLKEAEKVELRHVEVFRGLPLPEDPNGGYIRNVAQRESWENESNGIVTVTLRPLKYDIAGHGSRSKPVWGTAREKGVDVLCALALCRLARSGEYDVVVLASRDTDLAPAIDEACSYGTAKIEAVKWYSPEVGWTRGSLKTRQRIWTTSMKEEDFRACLDTRAY